MTLTTTQTAKPSKIQELFDFDSAAAQGSIIVGTDEAGRGPGAGPVFAAALCFTKDCHSDNGQNLIEALSLLNDSKQLSEKRREELFEVLTHSQHVVYSIAVGSVEDIEKKNILNTSLDCMKTACEEVFRQLATANGGGISRNENDGSKTKVLVDGNKRIKNFTLSGDEICQETVVKGDGKSAAIAGASILAKVARDRFMCELAKEFPEYGWERNKGYLTAVHVAAIKKYGATKWHRAKFLRNFL